MHLLSMHLRFRSSSNEQRFINTFTFDSKEDSPTLVMVHGYAAAQGFFFRNFDAFGNLSSNDGSQNDQVGMNSEVASVIREFTEPFRQDDDYEDEEEEAEVDVLR